VFVLALLSLATLMAFSLSDIFMVAVERLPLDAQPTVNNMARAPMKNKEKNICLSEVLCCMCLLLSATDYSAQLKSC
jgi:hypothetical protein